MLKEFILPELPYKYDALEPLYDKKTLEIHHSKHHAGYVKGLNNAMAKLSEARSSGDFSLIKHWEREFAFHGAGHFLHSLFWENMRPSRDANKATGDLLLSIENSFGSWGKFVNQFVSATCAIEGSGWGVLALCPKGGLHVFAVENHQKSMISQFTTIMVCDVWEHAYYLKYQNQRKEWVTNFMKLVNWEKVSERHKSAKKS